MTNLRTENPIFGTDGIRGRALEGWLSVRAVEALGRAAGQVLGRAEGAPRAFIGHDGRRSAPALEAALARGLSAAGLEPVGVGLIPTPGLAWLTGDRDVRLGAMISASHNPSHDNGIKLFGHDGGKLSDEQQHEIEERLRVEVDRANQRPPTDELAGRPERAPAHEEAYLAHLLALSGKGLRLDGLTVVIDCANGAGSRIAPRVLGRLGAQVHIVAADPDGDNINDGCGSTHPALLQEHVRARKADIGIALDGDGDRCILVDHRGRIIDGDGIMTVIAHDAAKRKAWKDRRIVATVMSNCGLRRALRDVDMDIVEVGVGDRAVVEGLRREGLTLGGEQSGHIVFGADNCYIGDGTLTALRVLDVMVRAKSDLATLADAFVPMPQVLINVPVATKPALSTLTELCALEARFVEELGQDGRVLLRYSGTEPKARVMIEGPSEARIQAMADDLAEVIRGAIGA
ncbi:MAG: phosphoglucosamine mutase [Planctomycetota bacterium]